MSVRKRATFLTGIAVLAAAAFLFAGCAGARKKKAPKPAPPAAAYPSAAMISAILSERTVTGDIVVFKDIQQFDIDHDGEKEIITVFASRHNSSGVKVVKPSLGEEESVIFKQVFPTPNTKISIKDNECILTAEDFDLAEERVVQKTYHWDRGAFVPEEQAGK